MPRYVIVYIVSLFVYLSADAQQPNYLFQYLGVKDGLYEETVGSVQQDAKGFIWVVTGTVLQRYDGHRFISFYPGKRLPAGNIRSMVMDSKKRIWLLIGDSSVGYLNPDNFKYQPVKVTAPSAWGGIPSSIYVDRDDHVFVIYDKNGFVTYDDDTGVASLENNPFHLPEDWKVMHLWQDEQKNYWVGTVKGLLKYNSIKRKMSYTGHNVENDPVIKAYEKITHINIVYLDRNRRFWINSWAGGLTIQSYDLKTGEKKEWAPLIGKALKNVYFVLQGFRETTDGALWVAGHNLFGRINYEEHSLITIPNNAPGAYSLRYDDLNYIFEDKDKSLWLGTNKGLYRFNPRSQKFIVVKNRVPGKDSIYTSDVTDFLEASNGEFLVSTWGNGVFSYDAKLNPVYTQYNLKRLITYFGMTWSMIQRKNGDIWCGMQAGAVFIMEAATKKLIQVTPVEAEGQTIREVTEDKNGNIWLGTHKGAVIQWDASSNKFKRVQKFKGLISRLYVDLRNDLWVCTDIDGVYRLNTSTGEILDHYTSKGQPGRSLIINGASDVLQYNDSIYFISGSGLNILNRYTKTFKYYTADKGLPNIQISNLIKDKNGYIWMTTAGGIVSFHPVLHKLSVYTSADGVDNYSFNAGAATLLKNGNIVFGTNHDFIVFNPEMFTTVHYAPPVVQIAGIEIVNKRHEVDSLLKLETIELAPDQNSFKILLATLQFQDVHRVYYMLEKIDKDWKVAGEKNVVEYNYLPPGNYVLKATCFHEDGTPGEITSLKIHIAAPFYRQWWFYSAIALLVTGLLLWLDRERMKRKEAIHKMRSNIAGKLHEEINIALNNINILSEIAKMKTETEPEKSKEFIEQIHSKSHNMIIAMDDMLWSIAPENDSMEKTIERMREFIDSQMNRHAVQIELLIDERVKLLNLPMQLRHEAFLLFKESINGLLQAKADNIRIHMGQDKSYLLFMIECDNQNCDIEQLNRFLNNRNLAERLEAIKAKLDVHVHKSYAVVECRIPLQAI